MQPTRSTLLVDARPEDFDWLIGGTGTGREGRTLPPGGVDDPAVLRVVRSIVERLHRERCRGAWLVVSGGEVVGLCSYRRPPCDGEVEIGYGIAPSRRGRGHATRAVALMAEIANGEGLTALLAQTSRANPASAAVLRRNGFITTGSGLDPEDGEVLTWRLNLASQRTPMR